MRSGYYGRLSGSSADRSKKAGQKKNSGGKNAKRRKRGGPSSRAKVHFGPGDIHAPRLLVNRENRRREKDDKKKTLESLTKVD